MTFKKLKLDTLTCKAELHTAIMHHVERHRLW